MPFGEFGDMGMSSQTGKSSPSPSPSTCMVRLAKPPIPTDLESRRVGESNDDRAAGEPGNSKSLFCVSRGTDLRFGDPTQSPPPARLSYSRLFGSELAAGALGAFGEPLDGG